MGSGVLQDDEHLADFDDVAGGEGQREHLAGDGGREFHEGLVGLDFDERLIPADGVAGVHEPGDDLAFVEALADVGEGELDPRH
jgi:hypothetical protein